MWSCDCIVNSQASRQENGRVVHFASEPVAFFKTKEGETIGVDKKGNKLAPQDTRYDLKNDEHGWKAAGKVKSPRKHFI